MSTVATAAPKKQRIPRRPRANAAANKRVRKPKRSMLQNMPAEVLDMIAFHTFAPCPTAADVPFPSSYWAQERHIDDKYDKHDPLGTKYFSAPRGYRELLSLSSTCRRLRQVFWPHLSAVGGLRHTNDDLEPLKARFGDVRFLYVNELSGSRVENQPIRDLLLNSGKDIVELVIHKCPHGRKDMRLNRHINGCGFAMNLPPDCLPSLLSLTISKEICPSCQAELVNNIIWSQVACNLRHLRLGVPIQEHPGDLRAYLLPFFEDRRFFKKIKTFHLETRCNKELWGGLVSTGTTSNDPLAPRPRAAKRKPHVNVEQSQQPDGSAPNGYWQDGELDTSRPRASASPSSSASFTSSYSSSGFEQTAGGGAAGEGSGPSILPHAAAEVQTAIRNSQPGSTSIQSGDAGQDVKPVIPAYPSRATSTAPERTATPAQEAPTAAAVLFTTVPLAGHSSHSGSGTNVDDTSVPAAAEEPVAESTAPSFAPEPTETPGIAPLATGSGLDVVLRRDRSPALNDEEAWHAYKMLQKGENQRGSMLLDHENLNYLVAACFPNLEELRVYRAGNTRIELMREIRQLEAYADAFVSPFDNMSKLRKVDFGMVLTTSLSARLAQVPSKPEAQYKLREQEAQQSLDEWREVVMRRFAFGEKCLDEPPSYDSGDETDQSDEPAFGTFPSDEPTPTPTPEQTPEPQTLAEVMPAAVPAVQHVSAATTSALVNQTSGAGPSRSAASGERMPLTIHATGPRDEPTKKWARTVAAGRFYTPVLDLASRGRAVLRLTDWTATVPPKQSDIDARVDACEPYQQQRMREELQRAALKSLTFKRETLRRF